MKTAKIMIVGFGNIGRGTAEVMLRKRRSIQKRCGVDLSVSAICEIGGSLMNAEGVDLCSALQYASQGKLKDHPDWKPKKSMEAIEETDADVVLELTPGDIKTGEPSTSHIIRPHSSGKNVVTSNKSPMALKFYELTSLAKKKGLKLGYEATVAGAIPIINLYRDQLEVNEVLSIYGILNGTSNFILSKMFKEDLPLETALKEAQELGIAERDPAYDIGGIDTAVKLVILANSLMDKKASFRDVRVTGIEEITSESLSLAKKHGCTIKLVGDVSDMAVSPRLVPLDHPMNVSGALNAVMLETDIAGPLTLVGKGAGRIETASSVLSDVMDIVRPQE